MKTGMGMGCAMALLALGGCASVARGPTEQGVVTSLPEDATIRTTLGHNCARSPCTIEISRKTEFTASAEREGYHPGSVHVGTKFSEGGAVGLAGNVLIGGVIGMGVDAMSGATLDHHPNPAIIVLEPLDPANPATPKYEMPPPEKKPDVNNPKVS